MELFTSKLFSAFVILLISLVAGLAPLKAATSERNKKLFSLGEVFASGIFLGAALLHLLPDAESMLRQQGSEYYPYVNALCAFAFLLLLFIEKVSIHFINYRKTDATRIIAYILALGLSIHSLVAGGALGLNNTLSGAVIIFLAIVAHKGSASFALAVTMKRSNLEANYMRNAIILFSLMTPLGILAGTAASEIIKLQDGQTMAALFNAFAAGTFLYIGTLHGIDKQFVRNKLNHVQGFFSLMAGFGLMAILAIWI